MQFLQWCTYEFQSAEDPKLHHNFARFFISPNGDCSIILLCHPSSVEVVLLGERENGDLSADLRSKMTSSVDENPSTDPFIAHVARSVRRQLSLIFECMRKEFFWFNSIRHEVCFLCPVCSQGGTINYCQTHRAQDCMQEECLHFWSESELLSSPEAVICRESVDAVKTRIKLKQFAPWLTHPDEKVMNECRYPEKFAGLKVEIEIIQSDFHALHYCIMLAVFIVCIELLPHFLLFVVFLVANDVSCINALGLLPCL